MHPPATSSPPSNNVKQLVTKSYLDIIQRNLNLQTTLQPGKERDRLITVLSPAAANGALVGVIQFILLRRLPILWMNRTLRQKYPKGVPKDYNWNQNPQVRKPLDNNPNAPPTFQPTFHYITTPLSILFDVTLSTVTASAVALGLVNQKEFLNVASSLPLKGGTSPISNVLCDDFVDMQRQLAEESKIAQQFWKENKDDDVMTSINVFVQNCKRRRIYEDRLRHEGLLNAGDEVILPAEGVPDDVMIEDDDDQEEMMFQM
uniref:Uncharacterized protein n=1 Tax=Helicotheca tamesis TaxID=374047 RepID=A0A7S2H4W5_9STRA|mmetsp:Transcript_15188/g.20732  ORF Transcript_15188/g.20732 Transcript_15188/m.20732 type:complete len:260 (+) Transcript_15188:46-825(+)